MVKAVVLISVEVGKEEEVLESLKDIKEVEKSYFVYGVYDIVAIVNGKSLDDIRSTVVNQIRKYPAVRSTITMVVVKELP